MFKVILLPLDGSSMAEHALAPAIAVARECGADLQLVYARDVTTSGRRAKRPGDDIAPGYVDAIAREISTGTGLFADAVTASGSAADAICQHARAVRADLVVMTSHGRTGIKRAWMGSVADAVVRESDLPVLMLREPTQDDWRASTHDLFRRILVPLDGSDESSAILGPAAALARCAGASVALVRVVHPLAGSMQDSALACVNPADIAAADAMQDLVDNAERQLCDASSRLMELGADDVTTEVVIADGVSAAVLGLATTRRADVIAMCTHARGASRLLIGSVADSMIRGTMLPLLLYHPHGRAAEAAPLEHRFIAEPVPILAPV